MSNQPSQLANPKTPQSQGIVALLRAKNQILYEILNWKKSKNNTICSLTSKLLARISHRPVYQLLVISQHIFTGLII
jgi:hypothetical protein